MFQHNDKFCKIQVVTHDLISNETRTTLYVYGKQADADANHKEEASLIYILPFDAAVIEPLAVEAAVEVQFGAKLDDLKKSPIFVGVFGDKPAVADPVIP